jgi:hypothetical protein
MGDGLFIVVYEGSEEFTAVAESLKSPLGNLIWCFHIRS